jgi:hypothetical protein
MLARYNGQLKLKDWAFAIAKRSPMRVALWLAASRSLCTRCCETGRSSRRLRPINSPNRRPKPAPKRIRRPREGADDGADSVAGANRWPTAISTERRCIQLTQQCRTTHRECRHPKASTPEELPLFEPLGALCKKNKLMLSTIKFANVRAVSGTAASPCVRGRLPAVAEQTGACVATSWISFLKLETPIWRLMRPR